MLVFVVDPASRRVLLLSSPAKRGIAGWEVVSGAMEAGETPFAAATREMAEEVGTVMRYRVIGAFDAGSFHYDNAVPHMLSIAYVAVFDGGEVVPGDDMAGSAIRWATLDEILEIPSNGQLLVPRETWLFERALHYVDVFGNERAEGIQ